VSTLLLPRERWKPFPTAAEREPWESLPGDARTALLQAGEQQLAADWPSLPASVFLEFARNGNRSNYERLSSARRDRLRLLVTAECLEGKGRFADQILNGIWVTCEETSWCIPAHLGLQKAGTGLPDAADAPVDLFAAETAALLAWTEYLLGPKLDAISPLVRKRLRSEIDRRILTPNLERTDFWWMGLAPGGRTVNNWNPWINSNWLTCALLIEQDEKRRSAAVHKSLRSLDAFMTGYHEDGGCDEGPSYWFRAGASLFDCLELLHSASSGAIDFYSMPLVKEIGRYIYRAHIQGNYFINFADASARLSFSGDLVHRYGQRIGDPKMQALGAFGAAQRSVPRSESMGRLLPALFHLAAIRKAPHSQPFVRDAWFPGIQVMAARIADGSAAGLYLAAQGGHNAESHNHNDVGNFIVYADGEPAIIDVGVETYSAKTFSSRRYEIWTMQSAYHNLPTIGDAMQMAGRQFAAREVAYRADDRSAEFSLDIAGAYPPEAGVAFWKRALRLDRRENRIDLRDSYRLGKPPGQIALTLMTPCKVGRGATGELALESEAFRSGAVKIAYDPAVFTPEVEEIRIEDGRLRSSWGDRLYRILLVALKPPVQAEWQLGISQAGPVSKSRAAGGPCPAGTCDVE
jgi:hypothetical protein